MDSNVDTQDLAINANKIIFDRSMLNEDPSWSPAF